MPLGSRFVLVGRDTSDDGPAAYTSPDGSTWTEQSVPGPEHLDAIVIGGPLFLAPLAGTVSGENAVVSADAESWSLDSISSVIGTLTPAVYGNDRYVAVDGVNSYTSTDGLTWTQHATVLPNTTWRSITYGNGVFVAVGLTNGGNTIAYSSDGETWSTVTSTTGWETVTFGGGLFVVHRSGVIGQEGDAKTDHTMTSTDGASWTPRDSFGGAWYQSAYVNGTFVALGDGFNSGESPTTFAIRMTSANGVDWDFARVPTITRPTPVQRELAAGAGVFVYAPPGDEVWTSTDGASWTSQGTFADRQWYGIGFYQQNRNYGWKVGSL